MARILIVDGSRASRRVMRHMLERAGHAITESSAWDDVPPIIETTPHDLLITDIYPPESCGPTPWAAEDHDDPADGVDLIERVKTRWPNLPIIAISTGSPRTSLAENLERVIALGVAGILAKPLGRQELLDAVTYALGRAGTPR